MAHPWFLIFLILCSLVVGWFLSAWICDDRATTRCFCHRKGHRR